MKESEIKLPIRDLSAAQRQISELSAVVRKHRHFEDNLLFDTPERSVRAQRRLLRVRIVNGAGLLTFKEQADLSTGIKVREEIETEVSSPKELIEVLHRLGFEVFFRYQKYRTIFEIPGVPLHFCLDETPIGNYFELEGEPDQIHLYAERLGYTPQDYITASYAGVYLSWCKQNGRQPGDMIFS
jgi:Adenylate cyclase, class 2 (thermophilic)